MDIAIIGMSCRFPNSPNVQSFWETLLKGQSVISEIPSERWSANEHYTESITHAEDKYNTKCGGFLKNIDLFDANFFRISALEAMSIDPQQRMVLELAWHCLEDSGYQPDKLKGSSTGLYLGSASLDYKELLDRHCVTIAGHEATGISDSISANRISYFFDWHGPSIAVDTACSSSLVALHTAMQAFESGDCESALVGGVQVMLTPSTYIRLGKMEMLSQTGRTHAFDDKADGFVRGEGGGFVHVKPLSAALEDGDNIRAIVKSTAINHGGKAKTITSPGPISQSNVIQSAMRKADVKPEQIGYIEAHGTGTPVGDPIEILGLTRAFKQQSKRNKNASVTQGTCVIGAVKTIIGHLEPAAGIAGLIKTVLVLEHETIPKNANFGELNSRIKLHNTPFTIAAENQQWPRCADESAAPRAAGISSFGFGGVNAHVILQESPVINASEAAKKKTATDSESILVLSAQSKPALDLLIQKYCDFLEDTTVPFNTFCATVAHTRNLFDHRIAVIAKDTLTARSLLSDFLDHGAQNDKHLFTSRPADDVKKLAFMFTGQGAQRLDMGSSLSRQFPLFKENMQTCSDLFNQELGFDIVEILNDKGHSLHNDATINQTLYTQPALFCFEYALAKFWQHLELKPDAVIGHSIGELVAACIANVFTLEAAVKIVSKRASAMSGLSADGAMLSVSTTQSKIDEILNEAKSNQPDLIVDIAANNAIDKQVISGVKADVAVIKKELDALGIENQWLPVSQAFHSELLDPILDDFQTSIENIDFKTPRIPLVSNISGMTAGEELTDPAYWTNQIRQAVKFNQGIEHLNEQGFTHFLEIGPKAHLSTMVLSTSAKWDSPGFCPSRNKCNNKFLGSVATMIACGADINLSALFPKEAVDRSLKLPLYQFDRKSYWVAGIPPQYSGPRTKHLAGRSGWTGDKQYIRIEDASIFSFSTTVPNNLGEFLNDHGVYGVKVVPAAAYVSLVLASLARTSLQKDNARCSLENINFSKALTFDSNQPVKLQTIINSASEVKGISFAVNSNSSFLKDDPFETDDNAWESCADGSIQINTAPSSIDAIDTSQLESNEVTTAQILYEKCAQIGLNYGSDFQAIQSIKKSGKLIQAELTLPNGVRNVPDSENTVHPVLLDASFHCLASIILDEVDTQEQRVPLPIGVQQLIYSPNVSVSAITTVRARISDTSDVNVFADMELCNEDGEQIVSIRQLKLQWIKEADFRKQIGAGLQPHITYTDRWEPAVEVDIEAEPDFIERLGLSHVCIVHSRNDSSHADVVKSYAVQNPTVTISHIELCSEGTLENDAPNHWLCNPSDPKCLEKLIDSVPVINKLIVIPRRNTAITTDDQHEQLTKGPIQELFFFLKALVDANYSNNTLSISILDIDDASCSTLNNAIAASVAGMTRSVAHEYPDWQVKRLGIKKAVGSSEDNWLEAILKLSVIETQHETFRMHNGVLERKTQLPLFIDDSKPEIYREDGVYVIFGGAKGIGLAMATMLHENYQAKVALVGRSPHDLTMANIASSQPELAPYLHYYQADIGNLNEVKNLLAEIEKDIGHINGIVHSAAMVDDAVFQEMSFERFSAVQKPKVSGSLNLAIATENLKLDFLLLFSSAVAVFGTAGQANYVSANTFIEQYARELNTLREYPVKVINWGFWGEIGLATDEFYHESYARMGVGPLLTDEGVEQINRALASSVDAFTIMKAEDWALKEGGFNLDELLLEKNNELYIDSDDQVVRIPFRFDNQNITHASASLPPLEEVMQLSNEALDECLIEGLGEILKTILRFDVVDESGGLEAFSHIRVTALGIDSLSTTELRNQVDKWLGIDLPPEMVIGGEKVSELLSVLKNNLLLQKLQSTDMSENSDEEMEVFTL